MSISILQFSIHKPKSYGNCSAMSNTALEALVSSMTLSDLAERSERSVEDIVNWALGGNRAAATAGAKRTQPVATRAAAPTTPPPIPMVESGGASRRPASSSSVPKNINTRTPEGRARYDAQILKLVGEADGPIAAATLRKKVGGTPLQVRASLNRLIESGQVQYQGRARATRYTPA